MTKGYWRWYLQWTIFKKYFGFGFENEFQKSHSLWECLTFIGQKVPWRHEHFEYRAFDGCIDWILHHKLEIGLFWVLVDSCCL